jgi:hypothetical protein
MPRDPARESLGSADRAGDVVERSSGVPAGTVLAVCRRIGMRHLGITSRWYHEPSQMFWVGARDGQRPSLAPDEATD